MVLQLCAHVFPIGRVQVFHVVLDDVSKFPKYQKGLLNDVPKHSLKVPNGF